MVCWSSLKPAFARVVTFLNQPSNAPPMLSRLFAAVPCVVEVDSKAPLSGLVVGGGGGARVGRCWDRNLLRPSKAGPGAVVLRSSVPTPGPASWMLLRWRWWRAPGFLDPGGPACGRLGGMTVDCEDCES